MVFACWPGNFRKLCSVADDAELNLEGKLKKFSFQELQVATDGFSNENMLRSDGYGPFGKYFRGVLQDGSLVAIKRLKREQSPGGELQFQKVMTMISIAVHQNLLKLLGVCITSEERLLVYPYLANGSVASLLRDRSPLRPSLDWSIRKRIALESAKGISFLHEHCNLKIIHGDVKAANVFLNENFDVFIGGFALAKLIDNKHTHITSAVRGTIGYIAPEFLSNGRCSEKIDIYGYGIMLLELITGQKAFDISRLSNDDDIMLIDWVKRVLKENKLEMLVDPNLQTNYVEAEIEQLIQVATLCTQALPEYRPKMSEVVRMVESIELAERWDEWQNMDISRHKFGLVLNPRAAFDSTQYLPAAELSGPR